MQELSTHWVWGVEQLGSEPRARRRNDERLEAKDNAGTKSGGYKPAAGTGRPVTKL